MNTGQILVIDVSMSTSALKNERPLTLLRHSAQTGFNVFVQC